LLACFQTEAEYLFVIDGKLNLTMMNKRKWQYQQRNDDLMAKIRSVNSISEFRIPGVGGVFKQLMEENR
jgi:hypothetical protein